MSSPHMHDRAPRPRARAAPASWSTRLSTEQLRFFYLHAMNPADQDIHICRTLRIAGALDVENLRDSVLDLAERHDILRSYYPSVNGQPQIWLRDDVEAAFSAIDLSRFPHARRRARADELVADELRIRDPFRLDEGPLFRVTAIKLGETEHALVFRFHHIIVDGVSARLFLNGLWETYSARAQGKRLERQPHQYRDFVEWESSRLTDEARADHRAYWTRKLARPTVLDLAITGRRPARHTREAGTVHACASPRLVSSLRTACRTLQVSPYMVMMSAFQVLLHKVTGEADVLVGTPIACRQRVEFQPMLGVLLNWLAFRAELGPEMTFRDVVARVRTEFPDAYVGQCSYESLISAAGSIPRDPARNPLFQVTLNYATYNDPPPPTGLSIELDPIVGNETHYDLAVRFEETGDSLRLDLTYYTGAMDHGTAEQMCAALLALAEDFSANPDRRISDARLPDRLAATSPVPAPRQVVIAATFTAEQIQPTLEYWLDQVGVRSRIEFAPVDQVFQALLAPDGRVASNKLGTNVLLVRCEDWKHPASAVQELRSHLVSHAERSAADTIVVVCPPREANRSGQLATEHERLERELSSVAGSSTRIHFLSWTTILAHYPVDVIDDAESDAYARAPYSEDFNVALGTALARKIHAVVRPGPKVILFDCDNTLWNGVVGEDGADGIAIDQARKRVQQFAVERSDAGVLVGLVSKNNEADVWDAFENTPGMVLRKEMIVAHRINWEPKSRNLESLAAELNLGVDSFVLIDDSPAECAEVRSACPGALVLQLPTEPAEILRFLDHLWPLDLRKVTETDRKRGEMYVANARREQLRSESSDVHRFVASLDVKTTFVPFSPETAARAAQLTQRTNQFNTTAIRRSEAELRAIVDDGAELLIVDVSDRFGDYGIVGLAVYRCGTEVLDVETFLVSCRALGRGVEQRILAELGRIADARGLGAVEIAYRRTAKNRPAHRFLESMAEQRPVATETDAEHRYRIAVPEALAARDKLVTPDLAEHDNKAPVEVDVSPDLWRKIVTELDSVPRIREAINATLARPRSAWKAHVAPRDELEASIARIWSEVLLVESISATDDYFAIGGDSIRSLAVVSRMRSAGLPVTVLDIHEHSTITQLAELIRHRTATVPVSEPRRAAFSNAGPYPLGFSQSYVVRAYARENLDAKGAPSGAFHIQDRLAVREKRSGHSMEALRRAVRLLIGRTSTLRTTILRHRDRWMQVETGVPPALDVFDLSRFGHDEQEDTINKLLFADRMRPFDPERSTSPMVRLYAIVRSAVDFELVVTAHHGFCDGWSLQGFYTHLFSLYEAYKHGNDSRVAEIDRTLAANDGSFREVVHHEQHALGSEQLGAFWRTYLPSRARAPAVRSPAQTGYQPRLTVHGDWRLIDRATRRAKASRTSLKAVLLEAFSTALANRLATRSPLIIAVVTNGRKDDLVAPTDVFGLCWSFVPIVSEHADRSTRLASLHRDLNATEAHARYPIEAMFQRCDPEAVVRASFNLTNFHNSSWRHGSEDLQITQPESFHRFHFPLNFNIRLVESSRTVVLKLSWSKAAFDEGFASGLVEAFSAELE